jgi:hypothetical protein
MLYGLLLFLDVLKKAGSVTRSCLFIKTRFSYFFFAAAFFGAAFLVAAFLAGAFFAVGIVFPFPKYWVLVVFPRITGGVKKGEYLSHIYNAVKDLPVIVLFGLFLRNFTTK